MVLSETIPNSFVMTRAAPCEYKYNNSKKSFRSEEYSRSSSLRILLILTPSRIGPITAPNHYVSKTKGDIYIIEVESVFVGL